MIPEWHQRRSKFNHDWLKNRYLNNLGGIIAMLENGKSNTAHLNRFLKKDWPQWGSHTKEAKWLINSLEREMSPSVLFEREPLKRLRDDTKSWLRELLHQLWLTRYSIKEKTSTAGTLFLKVDKLYKNINHQLKEIDKLPENLKKMLPDFNAFREACLAFSKSISSFPSEVLVV